MYKNAFMHFLVILQMLTVFVIGCSLVSEINGIFYQKNIIKGLEDTHCAFFQGINEREIRMGTDEPRTAMQYKDFNTVTVSNELAGNTTFVSQIQLFATANSGEMFNVFGFDEILLKNLKIPMKKGGFLNTAPDGTVRFITDCKAYKVGEKIPVTFTDVNGNESSIELLVAGIAESPFFAPTTSSTSTVPDASTLLSEYQKSEKGTYISGVFCTDDLKKLSVQPEIIAEPINYFVFFDSSLTEADIESNIKILERYGNVSDITAIIAETDKGIHDSLKIRLPDIVFISLIALVGFCGVSLLNMSANIKTFALYSILGCSRRKLKGILFAYVFILETSALIPTLLLVLSSYVFEPVKAYFSFINADTVFVMLAVFLLFFVFSFTFVLLSFKNNSMRQLLLQ